MLGTLLLSFGVPLLLGGDELGRTQGGNNNAYCQDNEISWYDWSAVDDGLLSFTAGLVAFRRAHPVFRRHRFLTGAQTAELSWFIPAGTPMTSGDWSDPNALAVGIYLDGSDDPDRAADGTLLLDDDFLVLVNAWWEPLDFTIPPIRPGQAWHPGNRQLRPGPGDRAAGAEPAPGRGPRHRRPAVRCRAERTAAAGPGLGHERPVRLGEFADGTRRDQLPVVTVDPDPGGQLFAGRRSVPDHMDPRGGDNHHHHRRHQQQQPGRAGQ
jgi:hypothetical protein